MNVSTLPNAGPVFCCSVSGVLLFSALYMFARSPSLWPGARPRMDFSNRRFSRFVFGMRRDPIGSTRRTSVPISGTLAKVCVRAHLVPLRFS